VAFCSMESRHSAQLLSPVNLKCINRCVNDDNGDSDDDAVLAADVNRSSF